jgi:hypothetical protein
LLAPHPHAEAQEIDSARIGENEAGKPRLTQPDGPMRLATPRGKVDTSRDRSKQPILSERSFALASGIGLSGLLGKLKQFLFESLQLGCLVFTKL